MKKEKKQKKEEKEIDKKAAMTRLRWQLALPGPMVLLLTILFWSLGGGAVEQRKAAEQQPGLNTQVPAPANEPRAVDKMSLYKLSQQDSMRAQQRENSAARLMPDSGKDANEQRINRQVAALKQRLYSLPGMHVPQQRQLTKPLETLAPAQPPSRSHSIDLDRMERLAMTLKESGSAGSPEMQELNRTLDKLLAAKVARTITPHADAPDTTTRSALPVTPLGREAAVSSMKTTEEPRNRFFDLESSSGDEEPTATAMEAIVPETQTLITGATIRLELTTELIIRGQHVPKGASLYGITRLANDRLQVNITSIRSGSDVYPVALRVLDQDGLAGIYAPGSITRDAARQSAAEAASSLGPAGLESTVSGQAMNAGIQLARNLTRRKVQLARITVKAGYRVFLQDENKAH